MLLTNRRIWCMAEVRSVKTLRWNHIISSKKRKRFKTSVSVATPDLDLNTIGARAVYQMAPWTVGGEFAYQFGEYDGD